MALDFDIERTDRLTFMEFSITRRRFITTGFPYQLLDSDQGVCVQIPRTMTIRFRNPRKLGDCCESWLRHDVRSRAWTAAICLYRGLGSYFVFGIALWESLEGLFATCVLPSVPLPSVAEVMATQANSNLNLARGD